MIYLVPGLGLELGTLDTGRVCPDGLTRDISSTRTRTRVEDTEHRDVMSSD